jgi:hypothetical protein
MYDPVVVDAFIRLAAFETEGDAPAPEEGGAIAPEPARHVAPSIGAGVAGESALGAAGVGDRHLIEGAAAVGAYLRRTAPDAVCVLYQQVPSSTRLRAAHVSSADYRFLRGTTIEIGERLTGWVAAHRETIRNADPALDLDGQAGWTNPPLRSCFSTPIRLAGVTAVLTVYSTDRRGLSDEQAELLQRLAAAGLPSPERLLEPSNPPPDRSRDVWPTAPRIGAPQYARH